jgi:hypothetical protein
MQQQPFRLEDLFEPKEPPLSSFLSVPSIFAAR